MADRNQVATVARTTPAPRVTPGGPATLYQGAADLQRPLREANELGDIRRWRSEDGGFWFEMPVRGHEHIRDEATRRLAILPSVDKLRRAGDALECALNRPAESREVGALVALMVSAYPSGRPADPEAYFAALAHFAAAEDHSRLVIAVACERIIKTSKFLPSVSEFLDACTAARESITSTLSTITRAMKLNRNAQAILEAPVITPAEAQAERNARLKAREGPATPSRRDGERIPF